MVGHGSFLVNMYVYIYAEKYIEIIQIYTKVKQWWTALFHLWEPTLSNIKFPEKNYNI
jgi:hypothetical protein